MSSAAYGYGTDDPEDGPTVGGTSPEGEVEGVLWDPDEETGVGRLRYEFWSEQVRVLSHLNPEDDRWRALQAKYRELEGDLIDEPHPSTG